MNNTRPLLKRVGAYLIDLCIIVIISSLLIPLGTTSDKIPNKYLCSFNLILTSFPSIFAFIIKSKKDYPIKHKKLTKIVDSIIKCEEIFVESLKEFL